MPIIKSSTDLRNNYNEISNFCNDTREAVFITKNGRGDLAVMSIESYELLCEKTELYHLLDKGRADINKGHERLFEDAMADIKRGIVDGEI